MEILNNNSPRSIQPNSAIKLWNHQLAMLDKCKRIETLNKYGIMSDSAGSGKTYVILALLQESIQNNPKQTNLIVVPHNIYKQWSDAINLFFNKSPIKFSSFIEYSDIIDLYHDNSKLTKSQIILTTTIYYTQILTSLCGSENKKIERIIFDEIDFVNTTISSINSKLKNTSTYSNISDAKKGINTIISKIIWFISASFSKEYNGGFKITDEELNLMTCKCSSEFIDESIILEQPIKYNYICKHSYIGILHSILTQKQITKVNALDYNFDFKNISKTPKNDKDLLMYLVEDIMISLDKGKETLKSINNSIINGNSKLIEFTNNPDFDLYNEFESYTQLILEKGPITDPEHKELYNKINSVILLIQQKESLEKEINNNEIKIKNINERLKESNMCSICMLEFESLDYKVITKCCQNSFCNSCIENIRKSEKYTQYHINCPMCRSSINIKDDTDDIIVIKLKMDDISNNTICNNINLEQTKSNPDNYIRRDDKTKIEILEEILKNKGDNFKMIIFSDYDFIFKQIKDKLRELNIKFTALDGGNINDLNKIITNYKDKNYNVLMSNSFMYGCGMNLENTTDIVLIHKIYSVSKYKQIIGRAQRPGRTSRLNIYELVHENELNNDIITDVQMETSESIMNQFNSVNMDSVLLNNNQSNVITTTPVAIYNLQSDSSNNMFAINNLPSTITTNSYNTTQIFLDNNNHFNGSNSTLSLSTSNNLVNQILESSDKNKCILS